MVTTDQVLAWCGLDADRMDGELPALFELVVAAVVAHIESKYFAESEDIFDLAVLMQTNRWWLRKDTPGGVIAFDELGAVRVTRLDPDVAAMLDPKVSFA